MKKITVALFVSLTLVLGAAACGDDDETTTGAESEATSDAGTTATDTGTTTATDDATEVTVTTSDTADGYTWEVPRRRPPKRSR